MLRRLAYENSYPQTPTITEKMNAHLQQLEASTDSEEGIEGNEIKQLFTLATAQIDASINYVRAQETQSSDTIRAISDGLDSLLANSLQDADSNEVTEHAEELHELCKSAVVSLQFIDRLSQRLEHVVYAIEAITEHIPSDQINIASDEHRALIDRITRIYSMAEEHDVLVAVLGEQEGSNSEANDAASGAIELF